MLLLIGGLGLTPLLIPSGPKPGAPSGRPRRDAAERPRGPTRLRAMMQGSGRHRADVGGPRRAVRRLPHRPRERPYFTRDLRSYPVGAVRTYTDSDLKPGPTFYYRVRALRAAGESSVSGTAWPPPDYGLDGFTATGLVFNGGAAADKVLHLTDLNPNEARSAFYRQEVDVRRVPHEVPLPHRPRPADGRRLHVLHPGERPDRSGQSRPPASATKIFAIAWR